MKFSALILFLVLSTVMYAQEHRSIHQSDLEFYKNLPYDKGITEPAEIIPLQFDKSAENGKIVFGFLPYWEYPGALTWLRYDIVTHISAFDFQIDSLGNVTNPSGWPWTNMINTAHQNGVKVIMTAVNFDASQIHWLITNSTAKQNFFTKVKATINQYLLDGVNIDFEGLNTADRGSVINGFMTELTNYIHTELPGKEVSFAGPAVNWSGWNLQGLAASCDYIFIMGYDFYGSWSTTTGPSAPLTGGGYNISNTVNTQYAGCPPEKLILGVPYYGCEWVANTIQPGATVSTYLGHPRVYAAMAQSQFYTLTWHTSSQTVYYTIPNNNKFNQVWFDNDSSTALKFNLAKQKNYRGVGMWALGYDRDRTELWTELSKYLAPTSVENEESLPQEYQISAYPNPFSSSSSAGNSSATVVFTVPEAGSSSLTLYDLLGRVVYEKDLGFLSPGRYSESVNIGNGLSSGTYVVRITTGSAVGIKSMMVKLQILK
jgi:spore germination protein YaaH